MPPASSPPDAEAVAAALAPLEPWARRRGLVEPLRAGLLGTADPAAAAANLGGLLAEGREPAAEILEPLLGVFGGSQALAATILADPEAQLEWLGLALGITRIDAAEHSSLLEEAVVEASDFAEVQRELRRHKRRHVLRIGGRDLLGLAPVEDTMRELSALADGVLRAAAVAARAQARREYGDFPADTPLRFVVLAMGKLGGGELNFSSDVDLVFLYDGARGESSGGARGRADPQSYAARLASLVTRALSEVTEDGFVFRVDLRLRPDGQNGPIVNALGGALLYYESYGQTWERAAMLKARPVAGDLALGEQFLEEMHPFIYRRFLDYQTVEEIQEMKARVDSAHSRERLDRDVKLGPGGIREVEFVVQALQLVHAGRDERLRTRSTIEALEALVAEDLLPQGGARALAEGYRFLRDVEHKLQIVAERQTQRLPEDPREERLLARRLGYHRKTSPRRFAESGFLPPGGDEAVLLRADLARARGGIRTSFERLFFPSRQRRPAAEDAVVADLVASLQDPERLRQRLAALGFRDPDAAAANLLLLRDGPRFAPASPRRRRALLGLAPALLAEVRRTSDPDLALAHMAEFISAVGARTSFLLLLEQNPETLRLLVGLFGASRYLSRFFLRHPELLDSLVRADLAAVRKEREVLDRELAAMLAAAGDYEGRLDALRRFRNEEFLRIGVNDIHGLLDLEAVEEELSKLAESCLAAALRVAEETLAERYGPPPGRFAVFALGKLGSRELTYNSDLDLIFVYDARPGAAAREGISLHEVFTKLAQRLMSVLQLTTREGTVYTIDTRLRPSGSHGPLVSSLEAFRLYHRESAAVWERQALIRARGVAGDVELVREVERVIEGFVYGRPLRDDQVAEIARLRARMEQELAGETERRWNLKTGRGGTVDVEFVAQMLCLRHGATHPAVGRRHPGEALDALAAAGLLAEPDRAVLAEGYRFLRLVESRLRIESDQPVEALEHDRPELAALARRLGVEGAAESAAAALLGRVGETRTSIRKVYERVFGID